VRENSIGKCKNKSNCTSGEEEKYQQCKMIANLLNGKVKRELIRQTFFPFKKYNSKTSRL
jgi:hypothetical protein